MVNKSLALFNLINIISITLIHNSYINILSKENEISQIIFKGVNIKLKNKKKTLNKKQRTKIKNK